MKRFEFIKTLNYEQMSNFLYSNRHNTRLGMKKINKWLDEETTDEDIEDANFSCKEVGL